MTTSEPLYGERVVGFPEVAEDLLKRPYGDLADPPHDTGSTEYHQLRGLILAQGTETEAAMGTILKAIDPTMKISDLTFDKRIQKVRRLLDPSLGSPQDTALKTIDAARKRRNRIVHDPITTHYNYTPYATGGGDWVPVLTVQGQDEVDLGTLWEDLALQQEAMRAAVRLWISLGRQSAGGDSIP